MLRVWVHGRDPGMVSDGSRLALCQTLSIECPSSIFFWHVYFAILVPLSLSFLFVFFFCSHWSLVDVPLISFCPADHVPDWQPRIVLGMVEALSVHVKKTTRTTKKILLGSTNTLIAGGPHSIPPSHLSLSPVHALRFLIAMQVEYS